MNDDIVTRLRTTLAHADDIYDTMNQAADELQRLQDKVKHLESEVARLERLSNG